MTDAFKLFFLVFLYVISGRVAGQDTSSRIRISVLDTPQVVMIGGQPSVYYELSVINGESGPVLLTGLNIYDPADLWPLARFDASGIAGRCSRPQGAVNGAPISLSPHDSCLIYIEVVLKKNVTTNLVRLMWEPPDKNKSGKSFFTTALLTLKNDPAVVIGAPLKEGYWAAVYDPAWVRGHRRVVFSGHKASFIPGRFAIDLVRLDEGGKYASGDDKVTGNWLGYGSEVIAVADGVVASTRADVAESPSLPGSPVPDAGDAPGNYISLKIGHQQYAFYEHLKPNSIKVKPGQQVKKGDVIAALGFTGQSTGPHLHFHLADRDASLFAQGIPFVFESFGLAGTYTNFDAFGKERWTDAPPETVIKEERPRANAVISFR